MAVDKQSLEKVLEQILADLQRKGILPALSKENKATLINNIAQQIQETNYLENAQDALRPDIKNNIELACKLEFANIKSPKPVFDIRLLFQNVKAMTPEEQKKYEQQLKLQLVNMLKELSKLTPTGLTAQAEPQINQLVDQLVNKIMDKDSSYVAENNAVNTLINAALDPIRVFRIQFYGVDLPGGYTPVNQAQIAGNQIGAQDLDNYPASKSFAAQYDNPDGQPDALSIKFINILETIANGILSENDENRMGIVDTLNEGPSYKTPNPFNTKLIPGGYGD